MCPRDQFGLIVAVGHKTGHRNLLFLCRLLYHLAVGNIRLEGAARPGLGWVGFPTGSTLRFTGKIKLRSEAAQLYFVRVQAFVSCFSLSTTMLLWCEYKA